MASIAKHARRAVADEHAEAQSEPEPVVAEQPVAVSALSVPGLASGEFGIRPKLTVGKVNDPAEVEADRVADGVVAALYGSAAAFAQPLPAPGAARREAVVPEVGPAGGGLSVELQSAIASTRAGGSALPGAIRGDMESVLGADLSAVRVHSGPRVADLASRISARAFTIGSDVFLPSGLPNAASPAGTHLLAHELAHAVANTPAPRRSPVGRSVIRRDEESKKALADLATPMVRQGPEVKVQTELVEKLEEAIPNMEKGRKEAEQQFDKWAVGFDESTASEAKKREYHARYDEIKKQFPMMDLQELYLGSIVLNGIPAKDDEKKIYDDARLESTDNALSTKSHAVKLVELSKTEPLIIRNTISTMITSGQIDYLRKAGFVGKGWKIIVEIHYMRDRPESAASMHKDTRGQTLFVNLNYANAEEMSGPEFVINPPLQAEHEQAIEENLPGEFMSDLKHVRGVAGQPKTIKTGSLPAYGLVSFVDEAIHHSTPLIGHRKVSAKDVRQFLEKEPPFAGHYEYALAAWNKAHDKSAPVTKKSKSVSPVKSRPKVELKARKSFAELFDEEVEAIPNPLWKFPDKRLWEALLALTDDEGRTDIDRPALYNAGLTEDQVDLLLSQYGPKQFTSASIPAQARKGGADRAPFWEMPPKEVDGKKVEGRNIVFKREMSQKALAGKLPKVAVQSGEIKTGQYAKTAARRAFFRTWVRAVGVEPTNTKIVSSAEVKGGNQ